MISNPSRIAMHQSCTTRKIIFDSLDTSPGREDEIRFDVLWQNTSSRLRQTMKSDAKLIFHVNTNEILVQSSRSKHTRSNFFHNDERLTDS